MMSGHGTTISPITSDAPEILRIGPRWRIRQPFGTAESGGASPNQPTMVRCAARTSASTNDGASPLRGLSVSPTSLDPHGPTVGASLAAPAPYLSGTSLDFRHFRHPGRTPSSVDHQR